MINENNLTDKQLKFIDVYFKEQNISQICKTLKITKPTYYNYLKDDKIKVAINEIRQEQLTNTAYYLQSCLNICSKELMAIITDKTTSQQTKINAINSIFNNCNKLTEQIDIIARLNELEQKITESNERP